MVKVDNKKLPIQLYGFKKMNSIREEYAIIISVHFPENGEMKLMVKTDVTNGN